MPIAVETIRQAAGEKADAHQQPSQQYQFIQELKSSQQASEMFGLDEYTTLLTIDGGEYAPMILDEYTGNGEDGGADMSFFGLPSPPAQAFGSTEEEAQQQKAEEASTKSPSNSDEAPACEAKPVRAMTADEMSALRTFFQEAPERASHNLRNKRVGDLRGASAKHILKTTGQAIHCVIWEGRHYISSYDIIKVLKVLVIDDGQGNMYDQDIDIESKKFEENVFSVLRQLKVGVNCQLEEARSDFLDWLVRHDCIRTQKKQKVFYWHDVNVMVMAKEIRNRCLRNGIPTKSILVSQRSGESSSEQKTATGAYPAGAKLPIQPQHKKPRFDAPAVLYPSIPPQAYPSYMLPYAMAAPDQRIQQMVQAYQAYQLQLQPQMQMHQQQLQYPVHQQAQAPQAPAHQQEPYSAMQYQDMILSPEQISEDFFTNFLNVPQSPAQMEEAQQPSSSSPALSMQSRLNEDSSPVMSYVDSQLLDMNNYPFAQYQTTNTAAMPQSYYDESAYHYYTPIRQAPISPVNERKHICNICGRGFKRNEHLKRHEFTHTGEKRHSCKYCNKLFARSDNLQQHLKQTHKKEWEEEEEQQSRRTPRGANSPTQTISQMGGMFDQRPSASVQATTSNLTNNANDLDAMLNFHFANSLVDLDRLNL